MSNSSFTDTGPEPHSFEHAGRRYLIHPRILSGKSVRAVRRHIAELEEAEIQRFVEKFGITDEERRSILDKWSPRHIVSFSDMISALRVPEALATALQHSVDELATYEQAWEVVQDFPNFFDLLDVAAKAMGLDKLKNSSSPASAATPGDQASQPASPTPSN
jgi:hypothetical protein